MKSKFVITFFLLTLIFNTGFSQFVKFSNNILQIEYPKNWIVIPNSNPKIILVVKDNNVITDGITSNFNVIVTNESRTINEIWVSSHKQLTSYLKDFKLNKRENIVLNKNNGVKTEYSATSGNNKIYNIVFEFIKNKKYVCITFTTDSRRVSNQRSIIEKIINTLILK